MQRQRLEASLTQPEDSAAELASFFCLGSGVAVACSGLVLVGVGPAVHGCFDSGVAVLPGSVAAEHAVDQDSLAPSPFAAAWADLAFRSSAPAMHMLERRFQESTTRQPD